MALQDRFVFRVLFCDKKNTLFSIRKFVLFQIILPYMLTVPNLPDSVIIKVFQRAIRDVELLSGGKFTATTEWGEKISSEQSDNEEYLLKRGIGDFSSLLTTITCSSEIPEKTKFTVVFNRMDKSIQLSKHQWSQPNNYQRQFSWQNGAPEQQEKNEIIGYFSSKLHSHQYQVDSNAELSGSDRPRSLMQLHEELFKVQLELKATSSQHIQKVDEIFLTKTKELEAQHTEKVKELERAFSNKRSQLEEAYLARESTLTEEFNAKEQQLASYSNELDIRESAMENADNTDMRRKIRKDILEEIKRRTENLSTSSSTKNLRRPIFLAMIALILAFVTLLAYQIYLQSAPGASQLAASFWVSVVKQSLYSLGLFGSILYFIRWLNRWFQLHADTEFQVRQFQLDIERASWVVETSLEWKKENQDSQMPEYLVKSLTKNLFGQESLAGSEETAADQLASALLGSASNIKLKAGENELEINPKKLRKENLS